MYLAQHGDERQTREQWTPMCFGVNDTRWARIVMSVGADTGADVEVTGWSRGLGVGHGAVVWQDTARIGAYIDDKHKDPLARLIEQELAEHAATYSAASILNARSFFAFCRRNTVSAIRLVRHRSTLSSTQ